MSVQQERAEDEPRFGSAPVPAPDPLTDPLDADTSRDPGPVTARAAVPPVFDHPVRLVTARGAARPPVPSQASPAPISAPPAQGGRPFDLDGPVNGGAFVDGDPVNGDERIGRHAQRADQPTDRHPLDPKTVVLPAFLTGKKEEPQRTEPARSVAGDKLPSTERGMLVFVAALLALGTIAVVVMLGFGGLTTHHAPAPPHVASPTPAAAAVVDPSPSDSPSASPSPSPSPSPSRKPAPRPTPTQGVLLGSISGSIDLYSYCSSRQRGKPVAPSQDNSTWICSATTRHDALPFTPDDICAYRYRQVTHAVVGTLADPSTWKCYR